MDPNLLKMLDPYGGKLRPYAMLVESLSQELARTHAQILAKIEGREHHYDDDQALEKLRVAYSSAIADYKDALDRLNPKIEIRNLGEHDVAKTL